MRAESRHRVRKRHGGDLPTGGQASVVEVAFDSNRADCPGDVTGDLLVNVSDLLAILGAYGNEGEAAQGYDVVEDSIIDVNDLLTLLGEFGRTC